MRLDRIPFFPDDKGPTAARAAALAATAAICTDRLTSSIDKM